jgi:opacity protein-like surface antigen
MNKILTGLLLITNISFAQTDLLNELEQSDSKPEVVAATFKGSRLVNGQTVEVRHKGELEFIFAHRFGRVNSGSYELFGLDQAYVRIGLEYGLTDKLSAGFGRNSVDKTMDGYLRYKLASQKQQGMPVTITAFTNAAVRTSPRKEDAAYDITLEDRMSYTTQVLIARKFTPALSLQLMPTLVHRNTIDQSEEKNDQFAVGAGGRLKISRSISLNAEYYYRLNVLKTNQYNNALGLGIDIETGGHVFQLVLTNTNGLTERAYLTETTGNFFEGDIHLGFNVTRSFQVKKK